MRINPEISRLRSDVREAERTLERLRADLARAISACPHQWSAPVFDPELISKGYQDPGYHQGVHFQPPMWIPEKRRDRWRRHCPICDTTEYTYEAETRVVEARTPRF